jgi:hypothetical protein
VEIFEKNNIKICSLLKIDCEGAEYEILFNTTDELFRRIENIFFEIHPIKDHLPEELKIFLTKKGYVLEVSKTDGSVLFASRKNAIE